jgi:hypothetical protein
MAFGGVYLMDQQSMRRGTYNLSRNLAKFGDTPQFWERKLEIVTEKGESIQGMLCRYFCRLTKL